MDERLLIAPFLVEVNNLPVFNHTITCNSVIPFSVECCHNQASSSRLIINSEHHRVDSSDDRSDIIRFVFSVKYREKLVHRFSGFNECYLSSRPMK